MRTFLLSLTGLVLAARCVADPMERFDAARRVWDAAGMEAARKELIAAVETQPGHYEPLYRLGVCEFYLVLLYGLEDSSGFDPDRVTELIDAAERTLRAAVEANPDEGECHAMLASIIGFRIKRNPWTAAWLGPRVLALQRRALRNDPDNPIIHYLIGAGWFRAPVLLRNTDRAEQHLTKANHLFGSNATPRASCRGHAETLGLLGDLRREQGNLEEARLHYEAALEINPFYTPARDGLQALEEMP